MEKMEINSLLSLLTAHPHKRQPRMMSMVEKLRWGRMRGSREKYQRKY